MLVEGGNGPVSVVMVTGHSAREVTRLGALTVAMVGSLDFHAEALVRLLPPTPEWERKRPVEVSCRVWPETTMPLAGEIWMRNGPGAAANGKVARNKKIPKKRQPINCLTF